MCQAVCQSVLHTVTLTVLVSPQSHAWRAEYRGWKEAALPVSPGFTLWDTVPYPTLHLPTCKRKGLHQRSNKPFKTWTVNHQHLVQPKTRGHISLSQKLQIEGHVCQFCHFRIQIILMFIQANRIIYKQNCLFILLLGLTCSQQPTSQPLQSGCFTDHW